MKTTKILPESWFRDFSNQSFAARFKVNLEKNELLYKLIKDMIENGYSLVSLTSIVIEQQPEFEDFFRSQEIKCSPEERHPGFKKKIYFDHFVNRFFFPVDPCIEYYRETREKPTSNRYLVRDFRKDWQNLNFKDIIERFPSTPDKEKLMNGFNLFFIHLLNRAAGPTDFSQAGFFIHGKKRDQITMMIAAFCNRYLFMKPMHRAIFIDVRKMLFSWKNSFGLPLEMRRLMKRLITVEMLVIDSIGLETMNSSFRDEFLLGIVRERINSGRFTILLSEFAGTALERHLIVNDSPTERRKSKSIVDFLDDRFQTFKIS